MLKEEKKKAEFARKIFDEYCNYVYIIVMNKIKEYGTKEDAEECVSDVFAEVFRHMDKIIDFEGDLKGYIGTVAKRRAIDKYRRLSDVYGREQPIDDEIAQQTASDEDIEESYDTASRNAYILDIVKSLGEPDTTIIINQFYYNMKVAEIAKSISMTTAAVQKRSKRARERLRAMLMEADITL